MLSTDPEGRALGPTLVALFLAAVVILVVTRVTTVLVIVFLAILLGTYLSTVTDLLERRLGVPRWAGLVSAIVATTTGIAGVAALFLPAVIDQTRALIDGLPVTLASIEAVLTAWSGRYPWLRGIPSPQPEPGVMAGLIEESTAFLRAAVLPSVRAGGELFIEGAATLVMALYLAADPRVYRDGIIALAPPRHRDLSARILDEAGVTLSAWVVGQLLAMAVLAVLTAIGLWGLGVNYWLAFGIFTGMVAVVPFFGTMVSTLLPAIFVISSGSWLKVLAVLALGIVVHLVEANFVLPRIMQRQIALPPVLTIASVLLMGTLLGPIGLIVAVPTLALTLVLVRHIVLREMYGDRAGAHPAFQRGPDTSHAGREEGEGAAVGP